MMQGPDLKPPADQVSSATDAKLGPENRRPRPRPLHHMAGIQRFAAQNDAKSPNLDPSTARL